MKDPKARPQRKRLKPSQMRRDFETAPKDSVATKPEKLIYGDVIQFKANGFVNGEMKKTTFTAMYVTGRFGDDHPLGIEVMLIAKPGSFAGRFSKFDLDVTAPNELKQMGLNGPSRLYARTIFIPTSLFPAVFMAEHEGVFANFKDTKHDAAKIGQLHASTRRRATAVIRKALDQDSLEPITIANFRAHPLTQKFLSDMSGHGLLNPKEEFRASACDASIADATQLDILPDYFNQMLGKQYSEQVTVRMFKRLLESSPDIVIQQLDIKPEILPALKAAINEAVESLDRAVLTGFVNQEPYKSRVKFITPQSGLD